MPKRSEREERKGEERRGEEKRGEEKRREVEVWGFAA
jgi:hypothetical protein